MEINPKNVVNYLATKCQDIVETELTIEDRDIGENLWDTLLGYIHGRTEVFETLDFDQIGMFDQFKMTSYTVFSHELLYVIFRFSYFGKSI